MTAIADVVEDDVPVAWGQTLGALGNSIGTLRCDLEAMLAALDKPVLYDADLPGGSDSKTQTEAHD